ncbi:MarR family transcriptional regulator [candidate division KSB1 bacterium]|nr:MarR family transcriptional regulator [candidate division KSB1 bacterium]
MSSHFKGPERERLALDSFVKLMRASSSLSGTMVRQIRAHGLTEPQFAVLEVVYHVGPLHQHLISEKLLMSGGNLSLVIDNLEKQHLIIRRTNPADRRCTKIHLTDAGRQWMADYFPEHAAFITQQMAALTPEEQRLLGLLCRKLGLAAAALSSETPRET